MIPTPQTDPFKAPSDPLKSSDRKHQARVVHRDIPIGVVPGWTVSMVRRALLAHQTGAFAESSFLVESVIADDRVHATLGAVASALFGRPVIHTAANASAEAVACRDAWATCWTGLAETGAFDMLLRWRKLLGFSVGEILWNTEGDLWTPTLKFFHTCHVNYRIDLRCYMANLETGQAPIERGTGKWFLHTPHGEYRGWQLGAVRAIAIPWLTRTYALRDWSRYSEVHGLPIIKALVPAGGDALEKERFVSGLANLGQESVLMLPQGVDDESYDAQLLEATDKSWQAFKGLIDRCDMQIQLALLHQNLMTEMKEGSFAAARQHADVREEEIRFSEKTFMRDVYEQIARPFALFNFGNADLAPVSRYDVETPEDRAANAEVLQKVAVSLDLLLRSGVKVDVGQLAKDYNIPIAVDAVKATDGEDGDRPARTLVLAPTDLAKVVRVDEARVANGLKAIGDKRFLFELEVPAAPPSPADDAGAGPPSKDADETPPE